MKILFRLSRKEMELFEPIRLSEMETAALIRRAILSGNRNTALAGQSGASLRRGEGYEFAELRAYVNGDDPRRIDWAATARVGSMQTRVMLEEHALFFASIIDSAPSMQVGRERSRWDCANDAVLVFNQALKTGDRCVRVSEHDVFEARGARIETAGHACAEQGLPTRDLDAALRHTDVIAPRGSALLVISDGWSPIDEATLHRISGRHDATFLLARDPWHSGFPLTGLTDLRDLTSGRRGRVLLRRRDSRRYAQAVLKREAELDLQFSHAGWRFGLLDEDANDALRQVFFHSLALGHGGAR